MILYEYKMLSEDEQYDTVFSKGKFQVIGFGADSFSFVILWRRNYRDGI